MKVVEKCQCTEKCSGSCGSQRCSIYIYLFTEVHVIINEVHGACLASSDSRVQVYLIVDVHGCTFGQSWFPGACLVKKGWRVHVWSVKYQISPSHSWVCRVSRTCMSIYIWSRARQKYWQMRRHHRRTQGTYALHVRPLRTLKRLGLLKLVLTSTYSIYGFILSCNCRAIASWRQF